MPRAITLTLTRLCLITVLLLQSASLWNGVVSQQKNIPALIVFGDSTVDPGNNNYIPCLLKSNFPPYGRDFPGKKPTGRFCNGRIPPDFISEAFGLKKYVPAYLDPKCSIADFATGVSFASAGTGYDNATARVLNVIPLWKEVEYYKEYQKKLTSYLGQTKAREVISESLYLISIGTNDFLENYYVLPETRARYTVEQFQDHLISIAENFIRQVYTLGARKFSYSALSAIGCVPLERTVNIQANHACNAEYNNVARRFNVKMGRLLGKLNDELVGIRLIMTNPFDILQQIVENPKAFGYEETERACCGTGSFELGYLCNQESPFTCPDADKYVFWDSFHPTEKTNRIVSYYVMQNFLGPFRN